MYILGIRRYILGMILSKTRVQLGLIPGLGIDISYVTLPFFILKVGITDF